MVYFGNGEEPAMKVTVNPDLCEANGICAGLAPEVFDLDDEDYLHILLPDVPARLADLARRAVASCPKTALRLEE
jgi:ferredoxin